VGTIFYNIDNPQRTTTSGTPQDTDGMWHSNFLIAKQLYVDIRNAFNGGRCSLHFQHSNDYTNGFFFVASN
jgi:hypothetical protein